jgi:PLP dependent protein
MMTSIPENILNIRQQIAQYEKKYARTSDSVLLLAVSKTHPVNKIVAAQSCEQIDFGENYLQEALEKISELDGSLINWHFIGPIQSNKTKAIAENFDWVHSVDRMKVAQRLSEQRPTGHSPLNVLLQVNLSREESKSGIPLQHLPELAEQVSILPAINLRGLMTIPAPTKDFEQQRTTFRQLAEARDALIKQGLVNCQHLSMGMSGDYEAAIAEGATIIRIGTDIFGARHT